MSIFDSLRKGFNVFLLSFGVSSPGSKPPKQPRPAPKPAVKPDPGKP